MLNKLLTYLKISRPGLWFPTIWIYALPLSGVYLLDDFNFWIGLLFVTFPLNFLVYGYNDYFDKEADEANPRKGNFLFGAKASRTVLDTLPKAVSIVILPFFAYFIYVGSWQMLILLTAMVVINWLYNSPKTNLKSKPPFELLIQIGYILTAYFSIVLNGVDYLSWQTIVYLCLFAFQSHIAGEIMDIEPDIKANKRTTAVLIGRKNAKFVMAFLLLLEVFMLCYYFQDYVLAASLGLFLAWLLIDVFILFKEKPYTLFQMKLFGIAINLIGFASMIWIWYSGLLLHPISRY